MENKIEDAAEPSNVLDPPPWLANATSGHRSFTVPISMFGHSTLYPIFRDIYTKQHTSKMHYIIYCTIEKNINCHILKN
ncbi:hypothetical protein [Candidatus Brachybacter algidus]|uniref:hypothetical protein n=1 Tax=Candidatus Brachybacter algidus TaxID=2982024 RepID=UPI001D4C83EC|nr:hypothetical protein [Candidatus Brachybacter algidus]